MELQIGKTYIFQATHTSERHRLFKLEDIDFLNEKMIISMVGSEDRKIEHGFEAIKTWIEAGWIKNMNKEEAEKGHPLTKIFQ
jgi:hypothetical protein